MSASKEIASAHANDALSKLFRSSLDARITQMMKILSTTAGVDSTICTVGYGLVFTSAQLTAAAALSPTPLLSFFTSRAQALGIDLQAVLLEYAARLKLIGGACSDFRTFLRLWGFMKVYLGAKSAYLNPPKDMVLRVLAWAQLAGIGGYYFLENGAYLAGKGIIKGWTPQEIGARMRKAIWVFTAYLVLDYIRLYRVWQLQEQQGHPSEKELKIVREEENRTWWRALHSDSSYFPLSFHWGFEGGSLSPWWADFWVGLLGASAGWAGLREALRVTPL